MALANRNYANISIANECKMAKDNAEVVTLNGVPNTPMLMFLSNGEGRSPNSDKWKSMVHSYADSAQNATVIELECTHYVFHYEPEKMAEDINNFIDKLNN